MDSDFFCSLLFPAALASGLIILLGIWSLFQLCNNRLRQTIIIPSVSVTPNTDDQPSKILEPLLQPSTHAREIDRINSSFANYGAANLSHSFHSQHLQQQPIISPRHRVPSISTLINSLDDDDNDSEILSHNEHSLLQNEPAPLPSSWSPFQFLSVGQGVFAQDDPSTPSPSFNYLKHDFGLVLPGSWNALHSRITNLQEEADLEYLTSNCKIQTFYKLLFVARHGQGYHNLAIEIYGQKQWDDYWSKLDGDGNIVWGPDPDLTPLGIEQAKRNNIAWKKQIRDKNAPVPAVFFVSPFTRAVDTATYTWMNIKKADSSNSQPPTPTTFTNPLTNSFSDPADHPSEDKSLSYHALVVEDLRETIGVHSCDKRSKKSEIHAKHPGLVFEPGFSEPDKAWTADYRETPSEQNARISEFLERLFDGSWRYKHAVLDHEESKHQKDPYKEVAELRDAKYISITAHSGTINSILAVTHHRKFQVPPGGMIPVLVKATRYRKD